MLIAIIAALAPPHELGASKSAAAGALLPILADSSIRGTLILVSAVIGAALLRRGPASARHALWASAICVLCALPALTLTIPSIGLPLPREWAIRRSADRVLTSMSVTTSRPGVSIAGAKSLASPTSDNALMPPPAFSPRRDLRDRVTDWLTIIWLAGALVIATRLIVGMVAVRRAAAASNQDPGSEWGDLLRDVAARLGIRRRVTLRIATTGVMPMTWGVLHPVVLLPDEAREWSASRRRAVMLHEMAHVARYDAATQVIAQLALAINWFNPIAWYATARLRDESELACDDVVLMSGTGATDYASDLLQLARAGLSIAAHGFASLAMARELGLEARLVAVLDPFRRRTAMSARGRILSFAVAAPLVTLVAAGQPVGSAAPAIAVSPAPVRTPVRNVGAVPSANANPGSPVGRSTRLLIRLPSVRARTPVDTPPVAQTRQDTVGATVLGTRAKDDGLHAVGFSRRRAAGAGQFITGADIATAAPSRLTDMFRNVPGIRIDYSTGTPALRSSANTDGGCVDYLVDGTRRQLDAPGALDSVIRPSEVAAIEIYGHSHPPTEFDTPAYFVLGERSGCELVVIWTTAKISDASRRSESPPPAGTTPGLYVIDGSLQFAPPDHPATSVRAVSSSSPCSVAPTFLRQGTQVKEPRMTVVYRDADIHNVVTAFATFSGRTIIVRQDVEGTVTTEVHDQPWDTALQSILVMLHLLASEDQYGVITIDSCLR